MYLRLESLLLCFLVNSVAPWVIYSWASVSTLAHWKQRCLSVAAKINELRWESLCWVLCGNVWGMVAVVLWRLTSRMGICTRALLEISRSSMAETREEGCNMLIKKKEPKVYTFWSFSSTPGLLQRPGTSLSNAYFRSFPRTCLCLFPNMAGGKHIMCTACCLHFFFLLKSHLSGCPIEQAPVVKSYKVVIFCLYPGLFHQNLAGEPQCVHFCLGCLFAMRPEPWHHRK